MSQLTRNVIFVLMGLGGLLAIWLVIRLPGGGGSHTISTAQGDWTSARAPAGTTGELTGGAPTASLFIDKLSSAERNRLLIEGDVALEIRQVEMAQDQTMGRWPRYDDMRENLRNEIAEQYRLQDASTDEILVEVGRLREQFWREGGNSSPAAWNSGYRARALAEVALQLAPADDKVIDELVETMQSVMPLYVDRSQPGEQQTARKELRQRLAQLRQGQYDRAIIEIANGRQPSLQDFVRAADLLYLVQAPKPRNGQAETIFASMQSWCEQCGWKGFAGQMQYVKGVLEKQGYGFFLQISNPKTSSHAELAEEEGFGRRLPSFRGPAARDITLFEELH